MQFHRARYYAPTIGRFTQKDPLRSEVNPYLYAGANPTNYIDPSGLCIQQFCFVFYFPGLGNKGKKLSGGGAHLTGRTRTEAKERWWTSYDGNEDNMIQRLQEQAGVTVWEIWPFGKGSGNRYSQDIDHTLNFLRAAYPDANDAVVDLISSAKSGCGDNLVLFGTPIRASRGWDNITNIYDVTGTSETFALARWDPVQEMPKRFDKPNQLALVAPAFGETDTTKSWDDYNEAIGLYASKGYHSSAAQFYTHDYFGAIFEKDSAGYAFYDTTNGQAQSVDGNALLVDYLVNNPTGPRIGFNP